MSKKDEYIWTGPAKPPDRAIYIFTRGKSYFTYKDGSIRTDLGHKVDPKSYSKLIPASEVYHVDEFGTKWAGASPKYGFKVEGENVDENVPAPEVCHVDEVKLRRQLSANYGFKVEGENVAENDKEVADRHNDGKPEMSYVLQGPKGLDGLAKVLEFGSRKYYRGNWLKGFPDTSLIDSMMRHLTAYISGEILDPESGLPHIDHIHANAKFLAEHGDRNEK